MALKQVFNMEKIQTNKKIELLVFEGYGSIRHRQLTDGAPSRHSFITKCNQRVMLSNELIEVITIHNCLPNQADIARRKFGWALKYRAAMADNTSPQTNFAAQKDISREQMNESLSLKGF